MKKMLLALIINIFMVGAAFGTDIFTFAPTFATLGQQDATQIFVMTNSEDMYAIQTSVTWEPASITVTSIELAVDSAALGPEFFAPSVQATATPPSATVGLVWEFSPPITMLHMSPGTWDMFVYHFDVGPYLQVGDTTRIQPVDGLAAYPGGPAIINLYTSWPINNIFPDLQSEAITISDTPFIRGDANRDDNFNLADAVHSLSAMFIPGAGQSTCPDAADANDDGVFNLADPVYSLTYLFVPGTGPMPPPFPLPGLDPTNDNLGPCN